MIVSLNIQKSHSKILKLKISDFFQFCKILMSVMPKITTVQSENFGKLIAVTSSLSET